MEDKYAVHIKGKDFGEFLDAMADLSFSSKELCDYVENVHQRPMPGSSNLENYVKKVRFYLGSEHVDRLMQGKCPGR